MRALFAFFALLLIALSCGGVLAQSAAQRVALIAPGDELLRAARAALEPWRLELVVIDEASPGASAPRVNELARELAQRYDASALVWVSEHNGGYALWVYDSESDRVIERPLSATPPFDEPTSAAVALSIKTLLRHSASAPAGERYGASTAPAAELPATAAPAPSTLSESPSQSDADLTLSPINQPRRPSHFDLEALAGFAFNLTRAGAELPRFGLAAAFWPERSALGLGLALRAGPGASVDQSALHARVYDTTPVIGALVRAHASRALRLSAAAGPGLHIVYVGGRLPLQAQAIGVTRVVPSAELELRADFLLASELYVGLRAQLSSLLRGERYFAREMRVLELARIAFGAGLAIGVALPD